MPPSTYVHIAWIHLDSLKRFTESSEEEKCFKINFVFFTKVKIVKKSKTNKKERKKGKRVIMYKPRTQHHECIKLKPPRVK